MAPSSSSSQQEATSEAVTILRKLISIPSISREEDKTADFIESYLRNKGVAVNRKGNNIWAENLKADPAKPTILLNSHHDTVKPNKGYTRDPFQPAEEGGKLFGLGSNDAGGPLVSLLMTFLNFYSREDLPFNLIYAATAEEEISGKAGVASILAELGNIHVGIVGEPTEMNMAVAEKGLMVLDCKTTGKAGHAAREEGINAIYGALEDIEWFRTFQFPEVSPHLGPVKMSVTMINAGSQHNVVPDECHFVVDVRTTDSYTNEEILAIIQEHVRCEVKARSTRLQPSRIDKDHPVVQAASGLGMKLFGSPTMSDQALMPFPTVKLGPGVSDRSHTADEFIYIREIEEGIAGYIALLDKVFQIS